MNDVTLRVIEREIRAGHYLCDCWRHRAFWRILLWGAGKPRPLLWLCWHVASAIGGGR